MKKRIALLLAAVLCVSLAACGEKGGETGADGLQEPSAASAASAQDADGTSDKAQTKQTVEVTLDNWQEYFEISRYLSVRYEKNAFDETEYTTLEFYTVLELKEAFSKEAFSYDTSDVAVEFNVDYRTSDISYDLDDFSFELTDCVSHPNATVNESEFRRQVAKRMGGGFWINRDLIVNGKVESHSLSYCIDDRPSGNYAALIDHQFIEQNEDGTGYLRLCPTNIRITRIEGALKYGA